MKLSLSRFIYKLSFPFLIILKIKTPQPKSFLNYGIPGFAGIFRRDSMKIRDKLEIATGSLALIIVGMFLSSI